MWLIYAGAILILIFGFVVVRGAPYVPSHRRFARRAINDLYKVTAKDVLVDIGSGDGIILRMASSQGARAVGYEINPILVVISKMLSLGDAKVAIKLADFWLVGLPPETTVVYAFAVTRDMEKIGQKMQQAADQLGKPLRLITYGAKVTSKKPLRELDAHTLYMFEPRKK